MNSAEPLDSPRIDELPSLYQRIFDDIRERIISGTWEPGYRIPFEHELTVEYDCSRMTVNKALSQLATAGLIERRRRSGSFVRRPRSQAAVLEIHEIRAEIEALGLRYAYRLMERTNRLFKANDAVKLGPPKPRSVLALSALHTANEQPFCIEERLINLSAVPEAADESFEEVAPGPWLIGRVPWSSAEHRISAVAAAGDVGRGLGLDDGAPCLLIERRTWSADKPVTYARFTYPADSFSLVARFEPK